MCLSIRKYSRDLQKRKKKFGNHESTELCRAMITSPNTCISQDAFCHSLMSALTYVKVLPMTSSFSAAGIPKVRLYKQFMVAWLLLETI